MSRAESEALRSGRDVDPIPAERHIAETRAQLEEILVPKPDAFPRSETMRFLTGRNGKAVALGSLAALMVAKPRLGMSIMRLLPIGRLLQRMF